MNENEIVLNEEDYEEEYGGNYEENSGELDFGQRIDQAAERANNMLAMVTNTATSLADTAVAIKQANLEMARLETQLDMFICNAQTNLEKFKSTIPMLERQLDRAADRIEKITDKILDKTDESLTDENLQKQSMLLDALNQHNQTFNNILMKLITM